MELLLLLIFAVSVLACVVADLSILYPLLFGYILFFCYGLIRKHSFRDMLRMSWSGVKTIRGMLVTFILIGLITAIWRSAGTIPMIVSLCSSLISPTSFILITFLLCCLISALTGTALGTAATAGVISMSMGEVLGVSPFLLGGAILSGAYFGDRCSPMSTSALLVCTLTGTNIFQNIRLMFRRAAVPFLATCLLYWGLGLGTKKQEVSLVVLERLSHSFLFHWTVLLPALLMILLAACRVKVKITMFVSILSGIIICLFLQKVSPVDLLITLVTGYRSSDPALASMLDGGGIVSMLKVSAIVCISSCYSGIFSGCGMLDNIKERIQFLSRRITPFGCALLVSVITGMAACNQTLTIMLTWQLCRDILPDPQEQALALEDSAVVISPLIPWSIASAVPVSAVSAPPLCIGAAFYLYLLPLWQWSLSLFRQKAK